MSKDIDDAMSVFRAAVAAVAREDWPAAAMLCDPASLLAFKRQLVQRADPDGNVHPLTAEQLMRHQPDMPREVAEYQLSMHERMSTPESVLFHEVAGVQDFAALQAMAPEEVFAAHLRTSTLDHQVERLSRIARVPQEVIEHLRSQRMPTPRYTALGIVEEGDRLAHVIYRLEYTTPDAGAVHDRSEDWAAGLTTEERELALDTMHGTPTIATCRRQSDGTWRLLADPGFLGLGNMALSLGFDVGDGGLEVDG